MSNALHKDLTLDDIHALVSRVYADIAARDADTAFNGVSTNINKVVRVDSPIAFFILSSTVPTWQEFTSTETDTLAEILAGGNTTGGSDIVVQTGDVITLTDLPSADTDAANKDYVDQQLIAGGDVDGPASATDNAVTRYDGPTGKLIQDSNVLLDDNDSISNVNNLDTDTLSFLDSSSQIAGALPNFFQGSLNAAKRKQSLNINLEDFLEPEGITFKNDGLKMYFASNVNNRIHEFDLNIPWDISTGVILTSFSVSGQTISPQDVELSPDGTRMYVVGQLEDSIFQYDLGTPFSVPTAGLDGGATLDISAQDTDPRAIKWRYDGLQAYTLSPVVGIIGWNVTTPFDLTGATVGPFFDPIADITNARGMAFRSDGKFLYITDNTDKSFHQYQFDTPWDITSLQHIIEFIPSPVLNTIRGLYVSPQAHKFYFTERTSPTLAVEFDLGVEFVEAQIENLDATNIDTVNLDTEIIEFPDASTQVRAALPNFFQGSLNATTLNFSLDISAQDTQPSGVTFSLDGLKMYHTGDILNGIFEYDLTTPWDISTASFLQSFSVATETTTPQAVEFSPDGTRMFVGGRNEDSVFQYDLSTPFNVTTAVVDSSATLDITAIDTVLRGFTFRSGGLQIITLSNTVGVSTWDLLAPFDLTGGTFVVSFDVSTDVGSGHGIAVRDDGIFLYIADSLDMSLHQYQFDTPWDITTLQHISEFTNMPTLGPLREISVSPQAHKLYVVDRDTPVSILEFDLGVEFSQVNLTQNLTLSMPDAGVRRINFKTASLPNAVFLEFDDGDQFFRINATGDGTGFLDIIVPSARFLLENDHLTIASLNSTDATPVLELIRTGTNIGITRFLVGNRDPLNNVLGNIGDLYLREAGGTGDDSLSINKGAANQNSDGWAKLVDVWQAKTKHRASISILHV